MDRNRRLVYKLFNMGYIQRRRVIEPWLPPPGKERLLDDAGLVKAAIENAKQKGELEVLLVTIEQAEED